MSRPTDQSLARQADAWMTHTFGSGMVDYLQASLQDSFGVTVSEIDRLMKVSEAPRMLHRWREEDAKSPAGRKPILDATAALTLILLQVRLRRPTLITEIRRTFHQLNAAQCKILHLPFDGNHERTYDRIWEAVHRLMRLVDEFPGKRKKIPNANEYKKIRAARDQADCAMRRQRMFELGNELVHSTWKLLPPELRDRYKGNVAIDATKIPMLGQKGNPSTKILDADRRSINYDAGYYSKDGSHGAISHTDASILNKAAGTKKYKGTTESDRVWAIEGENARMTANRPEEDDAFPLLTIGVSFHIPGAIRHEGARLVDSICDRGLPLNYCIVDRAYPHGRFWEFHLPIRLRGGKLVFDYKTNNLGGVQANDDRGFIQIAGSWYLDTLPEVLRNADLVIYKIQDKYKNLPANKRTPRLTNQLHQAETLYTKQLEQRERYRLKPKGLIHPDGSRRYFVPDPGDDLLGRTRHPYTKKTVTMELPHLPTDPKEAAAVGSNAGGLKHEQHLFYGTPEWHAVYGMRNGIESGNRNVKRGQFEDIDDPDRRVVRGNTFTYIAYAVATTVENLRLILSFFQRRLAHKNVTPKNNDTPSAFYQGQPPAAPALAPPDRE